MAKSRIDSMISRIGRVSLICYVLEFEPFFVKRSVFERKAGVDSMNVCGQWRNREWPCSCVSK